MDKEKNKEMKEQEAQRIKRRKREEEERERKQEITKKKKKINYLYSTPEFSFTTTRLPNAALKRSKGQKENKKRRENDEGK